jgi:hypothetical protein
LTCDKDFEMIQTIRTTTVLAVMALSPLVFAQPAAAHRHGMHALTVRVVPAMPRPDYVGAQGYPYGPPGPRIPTLIDFSPNKPASLFPTGLPLFSLIGL